MKKTAKKNKKAATRTKASKRAPAMSTQAHVTGTVVMGNLDQVKPNAWNFNEWDAETLESVRQGFGEEGWLASHALLVWGKDERGKERNIIIDGEHRWTVGLELGLKQGPMVFLNGITEAQARALTVKLAMRRGAPNTEKLQLVVRMLDADQLGTPNLARALGFGEEKLMKLLAAPPAPMRGAAQGGGAAGDGVPGGKVVSNNPHTKMVPLYFDAETHPKFMQRVQELSKEHGTETVTDTIMKVIGL